MRILLLDRPCYQAYRGRNLCIVLKWLCFSLYL